MSKPAKAAVADAPLLARDLDATQAQRLIDAAGDIAIVLDGDGVVIDVRARDAELQKSARRDWRGKPWSDCVTVESHEKVADLLAQALGDLGGAPRQVNHPVRGGPDLPVLYSVVRVAASGRSRAGVRLVALGRDLRDTVVLQRRLVEAQQTMERDYWRFREAETRYRNLFQSSAEAVLIVDGSTLRVAEANPAAMALIGEAGGRAAKVPGLPLASLFAAEASEALAAAVAAARNAGKHERLAAALAGSGHMVSVALSSFRQEQASFLLVRLAPQVAAAPRAARGAASGSARTLPVPLQGIDDAAASFVRSAADALVLTDTAGRVVAVNRAFARLAQLSSEDQARGQTLDRWLGRTGVELSVLLANLRRLRRLPNCSSRSPGFRRCGPSPAVSVASGRPIDGRWPGCHRRAAGRPAGLRHQPGGQRLVRPPCRRHQRTPSADSVRAHARPLGPVHRDPGPCCRCWWPHCSGPGDSAPRVLGLALAWAYSAPPLRLKQNGWWGNAACGLSYEGLAWVTGAAVMAGGAPMPQARSLLLAALYSAGAHGIMTLNDFKSVEGDRQMGVGSLPVRRWDRSCARRSPAGSWRCRSWR
jgi:transcriptional regulator PpsR